MAEYIEREAAIAAIKKDIMGGLNYESILKRIPSADVQPVKHGRWIWDDEGFHCTECFFHAYDCFFHEYDNALEIMQGIWKYCPHCGADMRETNDEKA